MKSLLKYPCSFLNGLLDRVFALVGAVLLAQFPQFYGQYLQRLGGHLEEARRGLAVYEEAAAAYNLTLEAYIEHHLTSGSEIFASTGEVMLGLVERWQQLESAFNALAGAVALSRWWVFIREAEWSIVRQAWQNFTPGVPTTVEGLLYAAAGLLLGWSLYALLRALALPLLRLLQKKRTAGQA